MSRIVTQAGRYVCAIYVYSHSYIFTRKPQGAPADRATVVVTTMITVMVGLSLYVLGYLDEFQDDRLVTFLIGIGVGKGYKRTDKRPHS